MEEVNKVSTNQPQVIYREGRAPEVDSEKEVLIKGTLKAPADYLLCKAGDNVEVLRLSHSSEGYKEVLTRMYHANQSTLYVHNEGKKIELLLNEKNYITDKVLGHLEVAKIWDDLQVNSDHLWSIESLRKLMKRIKFYFADGVEHSEFLLKLQKFVAKVDKEIRDTHAHGEFEKRVSNTLVNGGVIPEFKITAPIYKGYEKKTVRVEVIADVSDGSVSFAIESQDFFTLQEQLADEYINLEISRIEKLFNNEISIVTMN